ncbi:hypothetical protein Bca4012_009008 [Brassica carinata]
MSSPNSNCIKISSNKALSLSPRINSFSSLKKDAYDGGETGFHWRGFFLYLFHNCTSHRKASRDAVSLFPSSSCTSSHRHVRHH